MCTHFSVHGMFLSFLRLWMEILIPCAFLEHAARVGDEFERAGSTACTPTRHAIAERSGLWAHRELLPRGWSCPRVAPTSVDPRGLSASTSDVLWRPSVWAPDQSSDAFARPMGRSPRQGAVMARLHNTRVLWI